MCIAPAPGVTRLRHKPDHVAARPAPQSGYLDSQYFIKEPQVHHPLPITRRQNLKLLCGAAGAVALPAWSQTYPQKPIRLVVPVAAGGGSDLVARLVAERLGRGLGATVVVDNVSGGGGVIACQTVARAPADGYTLLQSYVATHGTAPATRRLPYDALADFTPIAMVGGTPNVLVVAHTLPVQSAKEFFDYAKKNVGKISYGSAGQGSLTHLAMEQLKAAVGFFAVHVPYRGIAPAINDMFTGSTQAMMPGLAAATPHIQSGKLRPLAVTGRVRHPNFAQVPTLEELGLKGFDGVQWYGISGPAKLPNDIVLRLNREINKIIMADDFKQRLATEAIQPMPMSPQAFGAHIAADIQRWQRVVKERGIQMETS
jgi:tripartite-type tricarboxylate transporter receptor subunit TctC